MSRYSRPAVAVASVVISHNGSDNQAHAKQPVRSAEVDQHRSAASFDPNATTHQLTETSSGGVETITANDPRDATQISLSQQYLSRERELLAAGNIADPMAIHAMATAGIEDLRRAAAAGQVTVTFASLPNGARLTYGATDPTLIDALHAWFDARLMMG